ncbi:helix-turn-helix domain-containing protein [Ornithinibacillus halophilus]|uniref:Helix-turn-helix n=1 Tax=Ornithinibacillus halophilus TaxID=930117 RepID=A0A1M5M2N1_9BACI|nr:helix-turn-helix transcriptional regulator [Ornithinibacillus halophilus]SHG71535.1 Helix-turn-helix [Ornithinibacillus halophilus]
MKKNIGYIIKLKRLENKLTQEELGEGICTPSYLSRIENNHVIPDESIFNLLIERLDIPIIKEEVNNVDINKRLENWHNNMLERKHFEENVYRLKDLVEQVGNEKCTIKFNIVYSRYLLMNGKTNKASEILFNIGNIMKLEYTRNYFLYVGVLMIYYFIKGKYERAIEEGLIIINAKGLDFLGNNHEIGMFYYNLALNYSKMYQSERCIHFSNIALSIFKDNYLLDRAIDCHLLLGISFNRLNLWEKSKESYLLSEKLIKFLSEQKRNTYLGMIYNNIGYSLECQGYYMQAITYYEKSLEHKKDVNDKVRTIINLVRSNYVDENKEKALHWLQLGIDRINNNSMSRNTVQLQIYQKLLQDDDYNYESVNQLEKTSFNYFIKNDLWQFVYEYSKLFAYMYEKQSYYKRANYMYKLAIKANEYKFSGGKKNEKSDFDLNFHDRDYLDFF